MNKIDYETFLSVDMRVGKVVRAETFEGARVPAIKLWIDFGDVIGEKKSSAQITANYSAEDLIGTQVVAVVNFPPKQIGNFFSEVLVLGVSDGSGIILLRPDGESEVGCRVL
tara:strand:+ start:145 stop:480 length:336 start_codon:yes stop_codon:yes gene_type:complete